MKNLSFLFIDTHISICYIHRIYRWSDSNDIEEKMISWRHDFHKYPEVSNREFRTSEEIAKTP